jgi:hypothetical protein
MSDVDVSVLRVALEGDAGKFVATEIERHKALRGTQLIRELGLALRRVRVAWLYAGAVNEPLRSEGDAKAVFAKHVEAARADNATGGITIVTIVVAARGELMTIGHMDSESLRRALEAAAYRPESDIVDVAAVVSHVGSAAELVGMSPLVPIGGDKNFCTFCGGPYPTELTVCPHCGARKA